MLQGKPKTSCFYTFHAETLCLNMKLLRVLTSHRERVCSQTFLLLSESLPFISPGLQAHYSGCAHRSENCSVQCLRRQCIYSLFVRHCCKNNDNCTHYFFLISSLLISWIHFKLFYSRSMSRWNMRYFSNIQCVCHSPQHSVKCPTSHFHS